jgi:hypothetical protein
LIGSLAGLVVLALIVGGVVFAVTRSSAPTYKPATVSELLRPAQLGSWQTVEAPRTTYGPKDDYFSSAFPAAHDIQGGCDIVAGDLPDTPVAHSHAEVQLDTGSGGSVSVVEELASYSGSESSSVYRTSVESLAACRSFSYRIASGLRVQGTNGPLAPPGLADQSALYEFKYTSKGDLYNAYFLVARKGSQIDLVYYTSSANSLPVRTIDTAAVADLEQPPVLP